jgi:hypothetical protein
MTGGATTGGSPTGAKFEQPEASHAAGSIKLAGGTTRCAGLPNYHCNGHL